MDLDKAIQGRKSVREFSNKSADWRDILECLDACRYAPMAGNNFTIKAILVNDEKAIKNIAKACQQDFVGETKWLVVFCSDKSRLVNEFGNDGEKYNKQQVGAAIQNFLLKIEEKKLATCWVGYFVEDMIKNELKIPEKIEVEAVCPIGYESKIIKQKRRRDIPLENYTSYGKYGQKRMWKTKDINV
jgi:nitroreductase